MTLKTLKIKKALGSILYKTLLFLNVLTVFRIFFLESLRYTEF